jgi:hypothetical protein
MSTIFIRSRMFGEVQIYVIGPDGGIAKMRLCSGADGEVRGCRPGEYAVLAYSVCDNSLRHLGKTRPNLCIYYLTENQPVAAVNVEEVERGECVMAEYNVDSSERATA